MTLEYIDNHSEQAAARWTDEFKDKPKWNAFLDAFIVEIQELEDANWTLRMGRMLLHAVGVQLDIIGKIVGRKRLGLGDEPYRAVLFAWIRANRSNGTSEDVLEVVRLAIGLGHSADYTPYFPASFVLELVDVDPDLATTIATLVEKSRLGGVNGSVVWSQYDEGSVFRFAPGDAEVASTTNGTASGDSDTVGTGGFLAGVIGA